MLSCSKNSKDEIPLAQKQEVKDNLSSPVFSYAPSSNGDEIKSKINNFRQRLQSAKSDNADFRGEDLNVEEAKWHVEALLNANHCRADYNIGKLYKAENMVTVPVTNGKISNTDLVNMHEEARVKFAEHYGEIGVTNKQGIVVDIKLEEEFANEAKYKVVTYIAEAPPHLPLPPPPPCTDVFDETDIWNWGLNFGRCCEAEEGDPDDAADAIMFEINQRTSLPNNHLYFTDVEISGIISPIYTDLEIKNPDDVVTDEYRDWLMFGQNALPNSNSVICIQPDDMNFYYCGMIEVINIFKPAGKEFISVEIYDDYIGSWCEHQAYISYGTSVMCDCPPCPPNIPNCSCC